MQPRKRKHAPDDGPTTDRQSDPRSRSRSHTVPGSVRDGPAPPPQPPPPPSNGKTQKTHVLENGKRRVRKGTKSCWQCRRRKIKCEYKSSGDSVCIRCTEKGELCRSQEYPEHPGPNEPMAAAAGSTPASARTVHQRLADMERALQLVVNAVGPNAGLFRGAGRARTHTKRVDSTEGADSETVASSSADDDDDDDDEETGAPQTDLDPAARSVRAWQHALPSPPDTEAARLAAASGVASGVPPALPRSQKLDMLRTKLLPLFPPQADINRIFEHSSGVHFIVVSLFPLENIAAARVPSIDDMKTVPPPTAHPLCMAKKLLQLAVIIQHLEPSLDRTELSINRPLSALTDEWYAAVSLLVTDDDDMLGSLEGLECLLLQCLYMANVGSLRKAWIICRRAISFAQLMGLGQGRSPGPGPGPGSARFLMPSVDPDTDAAWKPSPAYMWYRLNFFDRYTSLLLGLPAATQDASFARPDALRHMSATARLERLLTVASARISERNTLRPQNARDVTMAIYAQIRDAGAQLTRDWWTLPDLADVPPFTPYALQLSLQVMVQMHYFVLIIILHLPYMMKGATAEQRDYSKARCLAASREVLSRFCSMRRSSMSSISCRHVDYTALVGSMTLLLSYLDQRPVPAPATATAAETHDGAEPDETTYEVKGTLRASSPLEQQMRDRHMVVTTQKLLGAIAEKNNDRLTGEAASIVSQLLPIIDNGGSTSASAGGVCRINVPYLGVVTLRTRSGGETSPPGVTTTSSSSSSSPPAATATTHPSSTTAATHPASTTTTTTSLPDFHLSMPEPASMPEPTSLSDPANLSDPASLPEAMAFSDFSDLFSLDPNFAHFDLRGFDGHSFSMPPGGLSAAAATAAAVPPAQPSAEQLFYRPGPTAAEGMPGITADAGRWAFQGVDTHYWSLLGQPFGDDLMTMVQGERERE